MDSPERQEEIPYQGSGPATAQDVSRYLQLYQLTAVLRAGIDLGVFQALARGPKSAAQVADEVGADPRAMRMLLATLVTMRLLNSKGDAFELPPVSHAHLVEGRPGYVGGLKRFLASDKWWRRFGRLADVVRRGSPFDEDLDGVGTAGAGGRTGLAAVPLSGPSGKRLAAILSERVALQKEARLLDVASGTGLSAYYFARQHPHVRVTSIGSNELLAGNRQQAERLGVMEQATFVEGNPLDDDLGGPFDVIILGSLLQRFSRQASIQLLKRVRRSLADGGLVAINGYVPEAYPDDQRFFPRIFALMMLLSTPEGDAHTLPVFTEMLHEAGFDTPDVHRSAVEDHWLIAQRARG